MNPSQKSILVVEDELLVAEDIAECLSLRGFVVCGIAKSSDEAIQLAKEHRPDLALMDIVIQGDRDGIETAEILRSLYDIPVIFLTAYSQKGIVERAKAVSPLGYVVKPFEEENLLSTVEIALHRSGLDEEFRKSAEWFSTTLNSIGDGVIATNADGTVKYLNQLAEEMTGWNLRDATGKRIDEVFNIVNETTRSRVANPALQALESGQIRELANHTVLINKKGSQIPIDDSGAPIRNDEGEIIGAVLVFRDVTEKKKREKEVLNHQEQLEELVKKRTAQLARSVELEEVAVEISTTLIRLEEGKYRQGLADAVHRIGEILELHRCGIFETSTEHPECCFETIANWNSTSANDVEKLLFSDIRFPVWESMCLNSPKIVLHNIDDLPEEAVAERHQMQQCQVESLVLVKIREDHKRRWFVSFESSTPRDWPNEEVVIMQMFSNIFKSVLERRELERSRGQLQEQLNQSQKLEAVGKLTGGIAHDFNNMLVPIIGYADSLLADTKSTDANQDEIREIRRAAKSAADLTRQLLAFSRKQVLDKKPLSLNHLISDMRQFLQRILGEDIDLRTELDESGANVEADRSQMEQVIMNLCVNARDAMPKGGKLVISSKRILDSDGSSQVRLDVKDTGIGMPPETVENVFDPFFSTKGSEGTGLGLSVVLGVTQQHDGQVSVSSELNHGTTFTVTLPESTAAVVTTNERAPSRGVEKHNIGMRILLIEDEPAVLKFVTMALNKQGFEIIPAMTKKEAISTYDQERGNFDLIFTDAKLPDGNGIEVLEYIFEKDPTVLALISSGYTDDRALVDQAQLRGVRFLQKPYALDKLNETVNSVLQGKSTTEPPIALAG